MKISRFVDITVRVGESRSIRTEEEVHFDITGEEAVQCVFAETEGRELTDRNLIYLLSSFYTFIEKVPDAEIEKLAPMKRHLIAGFLQAAAKRFLLDDPSWVANEPTKP